MLSAPVREPREHTPSLFARQKKEKLRREGYTTGSRPRDKPRPECELDQLVTAPPTTCMAVSTSLASCGVQFHVAPLQCYTNQHLRALLWPLCPSAVLWTEMEKAEGLQRPSAVDLHSLRPDEERGPLVLQLGGGGATQLASAVRATAGLGFDEINLNAGCPSVETGGASYGARSRHLKTRRHPSLSPGDQPLAPLARSATILSLRPYRDL